MQSRLNPPTETLFLLANTPWKEEYRAQAIRELDTTGVDGASFYSQNGAVVERYFAAFEKGRVESAGTALLSEADHFVFSIYALLLWQHPEWLMDIDAVADEALAEAVNRQVIDAAEGNDDIITGLDSLGISDQAKWQVMVLLQKPRQQLGTVFKAVADNLPAFEKAQARVSRELNGLLEQFDTLAASTYGAWPLDLSRVVKASAPVVPTLAMPFAVLASDDVCFCGLLCYKLFRSVGGAFTGEEMVICAKALCDRSKVEILQHLKEKSLYGLEIAEKMGLTPATVSHHMGILLATGFVEIEKRGGKAFYQLSTTGIRKFLAGTEQLLL